ncbi:biotin biosynthesis protein BioY [Allostella sp. ATCC 35155]|nr:biotin biosynthesis protein BioY [Stella sp. ATCC 35155]
MSDAIRMTRRDARAAMRTAGIILAGVAILTVSAKVHVPSWPVPMTLQTLAVMAIALATGPRLATATFLAYLAAGAMGMPVFSGTPERGVGLPYMLGPTGGYLLGMLGASWSAGALARGRGTVGRVGAMLVGLAVLYGAGLAWLALFVPLARVVEVGLLPFVLGDLIKIAVVALAARAIAGPGRG